MREFAFEVVTTSRIVVTADGSGAAKAALAAALNLKRAEVLAGPGVRLLLTKLRISEPPELICVDGEDPLAPLEAALRAYLRPRAEATPTMTTDASSNAPALSYPDARQVSPGG